MARTYKRKTEHGNVPKEVFQQASDALTAGTSIRQAALMYNVNFMTLSRFIRKQKEGLPVHVGYKKPRQLFNDDQEKELGEYIEFSSTIYFGLSTKEIRSLAFECARRNNIDVPANWNDTNMASCDWLAGFSKRHSRLSIRKPEVTSLPRATSFNRHNVSEFFGNLSKLYDKYEFHSKDVWNVNERGIATAQRRGKIVTTKGVKQVGALTSRERGELVTLPLAVNAQGNSVPPLFIFPRKLYKTHMIANGPTKDALVHRTPVVGQLM